MSNEQADAPESGECFFCGKNLDSGFYCYGCSEFVCDGCNINLGVYGLHSVDDHLDEEDFVGDDGED